MRIAHVIVLAAFSAASIFSLSAEPKVAATISLRHGFGHLQYISNAKFKERPVTEQMAKDGIDLCWYEGWLKGDPLKSLKQFNALWLVLDHEDPCSYPLPQVTKALQDYVSAGGGLVVTYAAGRYPEAPIDAYWKQVFAPFGAEILHEEISDPSTLVNDPNCYKAPIFYASNLSDHPVARGVPGVWLALRGDYPSICWSVPAVKYSKEWSPILSTSAAGASYKKNPRTNFVNWNDANRGAYAKGPVPIVAARSFGKGRIVFSCIHKDMTGWMYNVDRWPNFSERGELKGKRSDALLLIENAMKWVSEPSMKDSSFTKDYKPVEPDYPPYSCIDAGRQPTEKPVWSPMKIASPKAGAKGVVGLHTVYSDGTSTVAEYVAEAKRLGLNFLVFTDDLAKLTPEKLDALKRDCAANSSVDFYCCPGVEYVDVIGFRWICYHDKVEFPKKDFLRDGRMYEVMKNGVVWQRHFYGTQNLYRGAILNMENFDKVGTYEEILKDFNGVVPKAYDLDRLEFDNVSRNKRVPANQHLVMTVPFTRVRRAADLARAMAVATARVDSATGMREVTGNPGANGWRQAIKHRLYASYGGVEINDFSFRRVMGTDLLQMSVSASSENGIREILVDDDAGRRVLARLDGAGSKHFEKTFVVVFDRQLHPCMMVTDLKGNTAYATPERIQYSRSGLNRCGDNANILSYNPAVNFSPNWDDKLMPCYKHLYRTRVHNHQSEAFSWCASVPTRQATTTLNSEMGRPILRGVDYPSEAGGKMPSNRTRFTLMAPLAMAIFDQTLGEMIMTPTRGPDRATYGFGPLAVKVADGRYWKRKHRVYQLIDRVDAWWLSVWDQITGGYRGGYTICEGEIEFTEDVELAAPISLCKMTAENPKGVVKTYRTSGPIVRGSYYATVADPHGWNGWFGLGGSDPLAVVDRVEPQRVVSELVVGERRKYRSGEKIRYRFAMGTFVEPPLDGAYCEWFASMMTGEGFHCRPTDAKDVSVDGMINLSANRCSASLELGPTWFIQDYPVCVSGLVDNGTAAVLRDGAYFRPIAFADKLGYVEIPLEKKYTWQFLNLFVADNPSLRLAYIPSMPGHEKAALQVSNPTDQPVSAQIRDIRLGKTFKVSVHPRSIVDVTALPESK